MTKRVWAAGAVAMAGSAASGQMTRYAVQDLGEAVPTAGSYGFAMNQAGIVAGDAPQDPQCNPCRAHAFVEVNGSVMDLGLPAGTGPDSEAFGINLAGQVVGRGELQGYYIPLLWLPQPAFGSPAGWVVLPQFTGGRQSQAWGINDAGVIAGESRLSGEFGPRPVLWRYTTSWQLQDLGTFGGPYGRARAVNNQGQAAGQANTAAGALTPFISLPEPAYGLPAGLTALDPDQRSGDAWSINEQGQISGNLSLVAFIWLPSAAWGLPQGFSLIDASGLGTLQFSEFYGLNTSGVAIGQVGLRVGTTTFYHGWVWERGRIELLEHLVDGGWVIIDARGVNEAGQIAATGYLGNPAQSHALVLTPIRPCYANCDGSSVAPVLNVSDFICFLNRYAAGDSYANCDGSTAAPVLNVSDFVCYTNRYAQGCP